VYQGKFNLSVCNVSGDLMSDVQQCSAFRTALLIMCAAQKTPEYILIGLSFKFSEDTVLSFPFVTSKSAFVMSGNTAIFSPQFASCKQIITARIFSNRNEK
jgi:hypothetical protein